MASLVLLANDYLTLSKEAGRRNAEVREASERAHALLKTSNIAPTPLYAPIFLANSTRNAKVIALAVGCLSRLITAGIVPQELVGRILSTLEQFIPQGVETQLKILQILSLLVGGSGAGNQKLVQGDELGIALELAHRLSTSKIPVVASTASATLRQLFMFVFERVEQEEDEVRAAGSDPILLQALAPSIFTLDVPPPEFDAAQSKVLEKPVAKSISLRPAARDAYLLLEDLCLLIAGPTASGSLEGEPSFLKWGSVSRNFGMELVESIISGFATIIRAHSELLLVLRAHLCPLLIRFLSSPPNPTSSSQFSFPLTLRITRVIFLLLKQFSDLLPLESESFLIMLVRVVGPGEKGEGEGGHPSGTGSSPAWMRVLALEIFRGLCGDFGLMIKFYERYDARVDSTGDRAGSNGKSIFSDLMTGLSRLTMEKPSLLGVGSAIMYGSSLNPIMSGVGASGLLEGAVEMGIGLAQVAGNAVVTTVGPGLATANANMKLQCIDQLDKADPPPIPETYIFLLALQALTALSDGFSNYTLAAYSVILSSQPRTPGESNSRSPAALDWENLNKHDSKIASLLTVKDMAQTSWPALLASLSFFVVTALDDDLFADVISALQSFTSVCGVLGLEVPREAFITSLCKFSVPAPVVAHLATLEANGPARNTSVISAGVESLVALGSAAPSLPVGLSTRNYSSLKALISVSQYLAGSLDSIWFAVFETLQNADFVIRINTARNAKRNASTSSSAILSSPTIESTEQNIQASISKLFEVSQTLDDGAFKWFVGALCRLNGEMIGVSMGTDGLVTEPVPNTPLDAMSPGAGGSPIRRRASGMTTMRTLRQGETSFGLAKLHAVLLLNVNRLISRESNVGWDLVTSHLLHVQQHHLAPPAIRIQAAEVLDSLLIASPKNVTTEDEESIRRIQTQVLVALAAQAEPTIRAQNTVDIELRTMALETLFKILETTGHSFISGWENIFGILTTACPSPLAILPMSPNLPEIPLDTISEGSPRKSTYFEKPVRSPVLVRTAFPSLQLVCTDFLESLTLDELRICIRTLSEFSNQTDDVNVSLTAGGLLWSLSDHLQSKRADGEDEVAHGELWMFLLDQLLTSTMDPRQEVRDGAISTVFRSISTYGSTLSQATWDSCMWKIVFPLIEGVDRSLLGLSRDFKLEAEGEQLVVQSNGPPIRLVDKQWDDSKTLAITSMGAVFVDFLTSKLVEIPRFDEIWTFFISLLKKSFVEDRPQVATSAMKSFERVLGVEGVEKSKTIWEPAWSAWEEIGVSIATASNGSEMKTFTQVNLEAYVRVALPLYSNGSMNFDLLRVQRLLSILKDVITFTKSPDYRPDIDTLTPVQASIFEIIASLKLESTPGAASAVLTDLSEYITFAYIAAFESEPEPLPVSFEAKPRLAAVQKVTYIALSKEAMPHVLWLFQRLKDDIAIYQEGAVERMLAAYALPMKLKYDCPAPSKFGTDEPLWKTATVNFLRVVRDCVVSLEKLSAVSTLNFEGIWRQIIEGYRGSLLADADTRSNKSSDERFAEENFDLALLVSLEKDILPHLGSSRVPNDLIQRLGKYLQSASRLYDLFPSVEKSVTEFSNSSSSASVKPNGSMTETRFDLDFDRQAKGRMYGTTMEVIGIGRERFGYWCFDLLFLFCTDVAQDHIVERTRIASLCLPSLMNRCAAVIKTYVADAPLRGKMPFPRVRQEELIFVLQRLLTSTLRQGSLRASYDSNPTLAILEPQTHDSTLPLSQLIRTLLLCSTKAHLYEFHPLFTSLLSLAINSPSITSAYIPSKKNSIKEVDSVRFKGLPDGFLPGLIGRNFAGKLEDESNVVELVLRCLKKVGEEIGAV